MYAVDSADLEKMAIARALLSEHRALGTAIISVQILQEFYNVMRKKLKATPIQARTFVESICRDFRVLPLLESNVYQAIALAELTQLSYWDAAILVSSNNAQCSTLYSEDMQHGFKWQGVQIVNPFIS